MRVKFFFGEVQLPALLSSTETTAEIKCRLLTPLTPGFVDGVGLASLAAASRPKLINGQLRCARRRTPGTLIKSLRTWDKY